MGELQGENPGTQDHDDRYRMQTNDDVPERGHHHNLRPNFCITKHGWIGAGGSPVEDV